MRRVAFLLQAFLLSGCVGSFAYNTDTRSGPHFDATPRKAVAAQSGITITPSGPPGLEVSGTSCKNLLWDPAPNRDNAINLMKSDARAKGFNAVHSVREVKRGTSLQTNCWASITYAGVGYKL